MAVANVGYCLVTCHPIPAIIHTDQPLHDGYKTCLTASLPVTRTDRPTDRPTVTRMAVTRRCTHNPLRALPPDPRCHSHRPTDRSTGRPTVENNGGYMTVQSSPSSSPVIPWPEAIPRRSGFAPPTSALARSASAQKNSLAPEPIKAEINRTKQIKK